jgi:hypothetical protein
MKAKVAIGLMSAACPSCRTMQFLKNTNSICSGEG